MMITFATPPSPPIPPPSMTLVVAQTKSGSLISNSSLSLLSGPSPVVLSAAHKIPTSSVSTSDSTLPQPFDWHAKYPELHYLADTHPHVISNQGAALSSKSQSYPEFDRSIQNLRCLDWIIRGNDDAYEQFVSSQDELKLSRESFRLLHALYQKLETVFSERGWAPGVLRNTLEVALVMGDLGKSTVLRDELHRYEMTAVDHDDFYAQLMKSDAALETFKGFQGLPKPAQELLKKTAELAHFGHITHLEGGAQMFAGIKKSKLLENEPEAFDFAWLVHICDVAGALGHKFTQGSKVLNQATFENMQLTYDASKLLKDQDERAALKHIVNTRSRWLKINDHDSDREVLARLSAMLRVTPLEVEKGERLVDTYKSLPDELKDQVRKELSLAAAESLALTPTYVPAMLINAVAHAQKMGKDLRHALETSLPLLCKALSLYRQGLIDGSISQDIRLDFSHLADLISEGEELDANQLLVNSHSGQVDIQGKVSKIKAWFWHVLRLGR